MRWLVYVRSRYVEDIWEFDHAVTIEAESQPEAMATAILQLGEEWVPYAGTPVIPVDPGGSHDDG